MSNYAPAAEAATKIITFLAESEQELGVSEISRGVELNKNMVFRILNSLEKEGWVYCTGQKYALTLLPFRLTSRALSRLSLNKAALPALYELADGTGESTYLGVLQGDKVLYLQHLDSVKSVRVAGRVGGEYDLFCSAPGKVLLAYADRAFAEAYAGRELPRRTENSITEKSALLAELECIRQQGYAADREEFGRGISCVAAPIFDHTGKAVAAVGCSAFTLDGQSEQVVQTLLEPVLHAARAVSARLGWQE